MLRKKVRVMLGVAVTTIMLVGNVQAASERIVIAPDCLVKKLQTKYQILTKNNSFALLSVSDEGIAALMQANRHRGQCGRFADVTAEWQPSHTDAATFLKQHITPKVSLTKASIYQIRHQKEVNQLLAEINTQAIWQNLTVLTRFSDRYANSDEGVRAAAWLKSQIEALAEKNHRQDVVVELVPTGNVYKQPSVVMKLGHSMEPGVVIGAHMDTLSSQYSNKPGADDDGSGTVSVLEAARALLSSGMQFKKPIYLVWYSAEEEGLVGSSYVVAAFKKRNIPVANVMQLDLTGYAYHNEPTIWLINDYVNQDLTAYMQALIETYVKQPVKYTHCGYACSDHATWTANGFASAMPTEAAFEHIDPYIHTSSDTMDSLSLAHMADFSKLAVAFAVELAEPMTK